MKLTHLFAFALVAVLTAAGAASTAPVPPAPKDTPKTELAKLTGTWKVVSYKRASVEQIRPGGADMIIEFGKDGSFEWTAGATGTGAIAVIDPSKKPKQVDYTYSFKTEVEKGIYKLEGDTFTDCFDTSGEERPTEFSSTKENGYSLLVYERVKPKN